MEFQIEVRPRSRTDRTFAAYYQVEAGTEQAALAKAMRRFSERNRARDVADYEFRAVWF